MLTTLLLDLTRTLGAEWVMWVLVALSVLALAVAIDRIAFFVRTRERYAALRSALDAGLREGKVPAALAAVQGDSLVRNVLRAGLSLVERGEREPDRIEQMMLAQLAEERARYEARLTVLTTIGYTAPFVGLLGTVLGIVGAFYVLGELGTAQAAGNPRIMAAIGEALVATGFSIGIAVPAVALFNFLRGHVSIRLRQAETLMRDLLAQLPRPPVGRAEG
jgi:biopolymer transport protein ExbB/TolQ